MKIQIEVPDDEQDWRTLVECMQTNCEDCDYDPTYLGKCKPILAQVAAIARAIEKGEAE